MGETKPQQMSAAPTTPATPGVRDEQAVACAAELFLERGIEGVKMVDIAQAAGVGVATLYRHFETKHNLTVQAATLLWRRYSDRLLEVVESDAFLRMSGLERLRALLEGYCEAYAAHGDFVAFLDEFDHLVLSGKVDRSQLGDYDQQLESFYPVFEDAYMLGCDDGSVVRRVDCRSYYLAMAHAIMGVAEKLQRGEVVPSDDFGGGMGELQCLVNMAIWSLSAPCADGVPATSSMRG